LKVEHRVAAAHPEDVAKVLSIANGYYERKGMEAHYWQASNIVELSNRWVVAFALKEPVYRWLGFEGWKTEFPKGRSIIIDKNDFSVTPGQER
jgi:hypothetical protein